MVVATGGGAKHSDRALAAASPGLNFTANPAGIK
jgi:hypothetical protein